MAFDWNDGPFEYVADGVHYRIISFISQTCGTTLIYYIDKENRTKTTTVWTQNGDSYMYDNNYQGQYYVRKQTIAAQEVDIKSLSDEDLVTALRKAQTDQNNMHAEIRSRGYMAYDEDGGVWLPDANLDEYTSGDDFLKYGRFVKVTIKEL